MKIFSIKMPKITLPKFKVHNPETVLSCTCHVCVKMAPLEKPRAGM